MMKYDFSAHHLKVGQAEANFGDAWEGLCADLLEAEHGSHDVQRLNAPDHGVDILQPISQLAHQCKATQYGTMSTIPAADSIASLKRAVAAQTELGWRQFRLSTNAEYSGDGVIAIRKAASALGLSFGDLKFLGPIFWSRLCEKHYGTVKHRLDYRFSLTEEQVVRAMSEAKRPRVQIDNYTSAVSRTQHRTTLDSNRIAPVVDFPTAPQLTVQDLLHIAMSIFGMTTEGRAFDDIGTKYRPRLSITTGRRPHAFKTRLVDISVGERLTFSVAVRWSRVDSGQPVGEEHLSRYLLTGAQAQRVDTKTDTLQRSRDDVDSRLWAGIRRWTQQSGE